MSRRVNNIAHNHKGNNATQPNYQLAFPVMALNYSGIQNTLHFYQPTPEPKTVTFLGSYFLRLVLPECRNLMQKSLFFQNPSTHSSKRASDVTKTLSKKDGSRGKKTIQLWAHPPSPPLPRPLVNGPDQKTHLCLQPALEKQHHALQRAYWFHSQNKI